MPEGPQPGRTVSLVLAVDGEVLGATRPFGVETPWWQDVEPISRRFPGLAVLRLLDVRPPPGHRTGGDATYLAEPLHGGRPTGVGLVPWTGELSDDRLRAPWAEPGGPRRDLAWARSHAGGSGPAIQHRTWNLSAIWSIPGPTARRWLKCVPSFFQHEAAVLELMDGLEGPRLVAAEGHRMLLEELPGEDGYAATTSQRRALIDQLVAVQCWTTTRVGAFLARGVPDRRWPALLAAARAVVARRAPGDAGLARLLDSAEVRVARIEACGLPDVLVHGDAHAGNARIGVGVQRWFDWGDARIGNPLLDVAVLDRAGTEHAEELTSHWLDAWAAAVPGSDPHRAWPLVRPLAALGDAVVYQAFLDGIEASERVYHEGDVLPSLRRAAALAGVSPP